MRIPPELRCLSHGESFVLGGGLTDGDAIEHANALTCPAGCRFPVVRGIPRFVSSDNYAAAFGWQWTHFRRSQLDSYTGTQSVSGYNGISGPVSGAFGGNMIRNSAFTALWLAPAQPDAWYRVKSRAVAWGSRRM